MERITKAGPHVAAVRRWDAIPEGRELPGLPGRTIALSRAHLLANRIVAFDGSRPEAKAVDMLRRQLVRKMDEREWRVVGLTSPNGGCGSTTTALNLAFSVARQADRQVLVVDLHFQRPAVGRALGIAQGPGALDVLQRGVGIRSAVSQTEVGGAAGALVLTAGVDDQENASAPKAHRRGLVLDELRKEFSSCLIIADLPPISQGDDALLAAEHACCALLVVAAGRTTGRQVEESLKELSAANVAGLVLNDCRELTTVL